MITITPVMTDALIDMLIEKGIEYIITPYEADAQLAYLSQQGRGPKLDRIYQSEHRSLSNKHWWPHTVTGAKMNT